MRVLLIDDDPQMIRLVRFALESDRRTQVIAYENSRDGVAAAARDRFDAVLLDVVMPDLDGPAAIRALRQTATNENVPVIFLTAKNRPAEIDALQQLGAAGVITKPFDPSRLRADLHAILGTQPAAATPNTIPLQMRREFAVAAADRLDDIERAIAILQHAPSDRERLRAVISTFHRLAGSAASYHFASVSEAARQAEHQAEVLLNAASLPDNDTLQRWRDVAELIRGAFAQSAVELGAEVQSPPHRNRTRVLCIGAEEETRAALAPLTFDSRFAIDFASTAADGNARLDDDGIPEVAMVSMDLPDGVGLDTADQLRIRPHGRHAALFMMLSRSPSLNEVERAEAVGADGFIDVQNVEEALTKLRGVIDRKFGPSPRILCVGIEPYTEAFTSVIESAGYVVRMVENGSHIDVDRARFDPDAMVAGIAGEGEEALRLARTVNLLSGSACPVILVGSGLSATLRVEANRAGAADVLQIPLSRALLLTTLEKHVTAARASKMAMRHDPLTGCLRETFFRERLQKRLNEKTLNRRSTLVLVETEETFACAVADLLRRRLRETDEIGRLGGGLFGVLMERIDEAHAAALCAKLRDESGTPFRTAIAVQAEDRTGAEWLARTAGIMRSLAQAAGGDASPATGSTQAYGSAAGIRLQS